MYGARPLPGEPTRPLPYWKFTQILRLLTNVCCLYHETFPQFHNSFQTFHKCLPQKKLSLSPPNYVTHCCKTVDKNIFWKNAFLNEGTRFVECWRFHLPWHKHSTFRVSLILRCFGLWDPPSVGAKNFVVKKIQIFICKKHMLKVLWSPYSAYVKQALQFVTFPSHANALSERLGDFGKLTLCLYSSCRIQTVISKQVLPESGDFGKIWLWQQQR